MKATHSFKARAFQSTHPTRGCDGFDLLVIDEAQISIHAPHEGVRRRCRVSKYKSKNFNPRTPRGGATWITRLICDISNISIHAPHEGVRLYKILNDMLQILQISIHAPHEGVRRYLATLLSHYGFISIHAPHEGVRPPQEKL